MKRTYSQIDIEERRKIARWRTIGVKVDIIAENSGVIAQRFSGSLGAIPSPMCRCPNLTDITV